MRTLECKWCQRSFIPTNSRNIFCSRKCKSDYSNSLKQRFSWEVVKSCKYCQCEFNTLSNSKKIFCSGKCNNIHVRERGLKKYKSIPCTVCGEKFVPKRFANKRCSKNCIRQEKLSKEKHRVCGAYQCGKEFTTRRDQKYFCNQECYKNSKYRASKCINCDRWFKSRATEKINPRKFCSEKCHKESMPTHYIKKKSPIVYLNL